MKKILALLVSLVLIVSLAVTAFAAETKFTVETVSGTFKAGDEVVVGVKISGNSGVAGMTFSVDYDKTRLKLIGYEDSGIKGWTVGIENASASWAEIANYTGNGEILKLKFKVLNNIESGFVKISISELEAFDSDEKEVPCTAVSGGITVTGICKHTETEVKNKKDATCSEEGYTGDTVCKSCGEILKKGEATQKDPQNHVGGTEVKDVKKANCIDKGYTGNTYCKGCGAKLSEGQETEVDSNNHKNVEVINKREANCKEPGYSGDKHCKACDTIIEKGTEIAKNNNHKFGAWKITKEATKEAEGIKERVCSVCDKVETAKIPKLSDDSPSIHVSANMSDNKEQNPNTGAESVIGVIALAAVCTEVYIVAKKKY